MRCGNVSEFYYSRHVIPDVDVLGTVT